VDVSVDTGVPVGVALPDAVPVRDVVALGVPVREGVVDGEAPNNKDVGVGVPAAVREAVPV